MKNKKTYNTLGIVVWWVFAISMVLTVYVNYYLPHGLSYPTGEVVCQNDDRGPCGEQYKEDMSQLNIPDWAKFLRENFVLFFIGLPILAMYLQAKGGKEFKE
jgi:hypothetical protein